MFVSKKLKLTKLIPKMRFITASRYEQLFTCDYPDPVPIPPCDSVLCHTVSSIKPLDKTQIEIGERYRPVAKMDIDDILASVDRDNYSSSLESTAIDHQQLTRLWVAERAVTELLPWPAQVMDRMMDRVRKQVCNRSFSSSEKVEYWNLLKRWREIWKKIGREYRRSHCLVVRNVEYVFN